MEESWEEMGEGLSSSARIVFASCLPSSTPHWSKLKREEKEGKGREGKER